MQISFNWLKRHLPFQLTPNDLAEILTNTGLEVEEIVPWESVRGGLKEVVIGEIVSCEQHPDADKLKVTKVNIGEPDLIQVVCGAPNCRVGLKSPVAKIGAVLYPSGTSDAFAIKKSKIRGVESFGMICADDELGLGSSHDGIMELPTDTVVGTRAADYFGVEQDYIISIGLTPNRSDAFSHIGVARDLKAALAAVFNIELDWTTHPFDFKPTIDSPISVTIENQLACKRYSSVYLKGVKVTSSPLWLQNKLKAIGLKPINSVVDVTNFVLHETGQPLHAFDASKIANQKIVVKTGGYELMTTLDHVERKLHADDLLICDSDKPLCIAGVYGGENSGVSSETQEVFLESAFFDPIFVRKTATRHNLRTDASQHFEKTTDINATKNALQLAVQLLSEMGELSYSAIQDVYPAVVSPAIISTSYERINKLTGTILPKAKVDKILSDLGFSTKHTEVGELIVEVPSYRTEVTREADLLEEILRIYGYNSIPLPKFLKTALSIPPKKDMLTLENKIANLLIGDGYYEVSTNSIASSNLETATELKSKAVLLLNAQNTELDSLRTSMVYSHLEVVSRNINHKAADLKLFEFGKTYTKSEGKYTQQSHLCLLQTGDYNLQNWITKEEPTSYFHLKTTVTNLLNRFAGDYMTTAFENNGVYSYGINISIEDKAVGTFGAISKSILKQFDIKQAVFYADVDIEALLERSQFQLLRFKELAKYPSVVRDLSLALPLQTAFADVEVAALAANSKLLKSVSLFDVYKGDKIEAGKKSYAVKFTFQDENKTLTDKDIDKAMSRIIEKLETNIGAEIRGK